VRKLRTSFIHHLTLDVKVMVKVTASIRHFTPAPPEQGQAVVVPGAEQLPLTAQVIADYIRQDAPRLLNDLEAVVRTYVCNAYMSLSAPAFCPLSDTSLARWGLVARR
jgi:hypothetical protein